MTSIASEDPAAGRPTKLTRGKAGVAVAVALAAAAGVTCHPRSPLARENPLVRRVFYPPVVPKGPGLDADTGGASFDHAAFGRILDSAVDAKGFVRYDIVKERESELGAYLSRLGSADPDALSRHELLALLINAYNACTLKLVIEHPDASSIRDIPARSRWTDRRWRVAGRTVSLEQLEHEWIRPEFGEPRIHFALVCAAVGCPKLDVEPYAGSRLAEQLDDQARHFFAQPRNLAWDPGSQTLAVSELLDWYRDDFGAGKQGIVEYVKMYAPAAVRDGLESSGADAKLRYLRYDWSLNGAWVGPEATH